MMPDPIYFSDHSIQIQSFQTGQIRPRRYRNRRLGDFLKELELTEGRATGIPTIFKAFKNNGSPLPRFNTDEDHTFFEVELFVHPVFNKISSDEVEVLKSERTKIALDKFLDRVIEQSFVTTKGNESNVASNIAVEIQNADNNGDEYSNSSDSNLASTIADAIDENPQYIDNDIAEVFDCIDISMSNAIVETITEKELKLLNTTKQPGKREMMFVDKASKTQDKL